MTIDTTDAILAGLGIGGFLWMNNKLNVERRARVAAEQRLDCARVCATRLERPANGLAPASSPVATTKGFAPRMFDSIFAAHGHGIPVAYLRALALRESNMNPREASDPAWGLLQVIEVVRQDYNQRTGARFSRQDLLDPVVNVAVAASALATIVRSYAQNHPRVRNLQADWNNARFIELLTFGWNAGWSERGGVGRVASYLEQRGALEQTIDTIHMASRAAGASPLLANPAKVAWSKSVTAQYLRERAADERLRAPGSVIEMPEDYVGRPTLVMTGPITQPSQVMTSGPITSQSLVTTDARPPSLASPPVVAVAPAVAAQPSPVATPTLTVASVPAIAPSAAGAPNPSGAPGPINPYGECVCS